ncbi:kif1 [Symbiodinium natans]|uniref:Kif1 protein n=1 Tax=Symbiodinium natans TaxID=878477 RepID=A0A812UV10_9DINO|nr:kif1 [Symbiodinium natans]
MRWYREAELMHGRVAMLAVFKVIVDSSFPGVMPSEQAASDSTWELVQMMALLEAFRGYRLFVNQDAIAGDLGLGAGPMTNGWKMSWDMTVQELAEKQYKELQNGRLAMLAFAGMITQYLVTGRPVGFADDSQPFQFIEGVEQVVRANDLALTVAGSVMALDGIRRISMPDQSIAGKALNIAKLSVGVQAPDVPLPEGVVAGQVPQHLDVSPAQIQQFEEDGVIMIKGAMKDWVPFLRSVTEDQIEKPHLWSLVGRMSGMYDYIQRNMWMTNNGFRDFLAGYATFNHIPNTLPCRVLCCLAFHGAVMKRLFKMQTVRFNTGISSIQTSLFLEARSAKVPMMPMVPRLTSLAPESQATPASEEAQANYSQAEPSEEEDGDTQNYTLGGAQAQGENRTAALDMVVTTRYEWTNHSDDSTTTGALFSMTSTSLPSDESRSSDDACRCAQRGEEKPPASTKGELPKLLAEMRKHLRIFVYPLATKCGRIQSGNRGYWVEWIFYSRALASSLRVQNADAATVFYIPTFTSCWRSQVRSRRGGGERAARELRNALRTVASQWPYFHRYKGRRHLWVSAHDMGKVEPSWCPEQRKNPSDLCSDHLPNALAINGSVLANTADTRDRLAYGVYAFNSKLDVALVCNGDTALAHAGRKAVKDSGSRRYSVFFAGKWDKSYVKGVRYAAIRSIQKQKLTKPVRIEKKMSDKDYRQSLQSSELCLAPRGSRVWSPRLFEMMWFGCIPVIIASGYYLPGACFFDWTEFTIIVPEEKADQAGEIILPYLADSKRLTSMRRKVLELRHHFEWNSKETEGDAFELALLDVFSDELCVLNRPDGDGDGDPTSRQSWCFLVRVHIRCFPLLLLEGDVGVHNWHSVILCLVLLAWPGIGFDCGAWNLRMTEAEAVVVGVRVRPFAERAELQNNATLCLSMSQKSTCIQDSSGKEQMFTFNESFWSHDGFEDDGTGYLRPKRGSQYADQKYVFDTFGKRVLDNAWNGYHCCLFAYGQTGSGKSYSMVGYGNNKGIVPISCEEIFRRIAKDDDNGNSYEVMVSAIEIYNEGVQDLLIPVLQRPRKGFEIRESKILGIYIDGITKRPVDSYRAIHDTIEEATTHRTVGSTLMNATSSRAHTVLMVEFKAVSAGSTRVSMINLVDLAGSEKVKQTGAEGERMKEGAMINKSLSALGNVIEKLAEKSTNPKKAAVIVVPYRESKLTRLLQNALGGSSKTIMICALSPASSNYDETLSTLRYADRAKKIKNKAVVNENPQEKLMRELMEENQKLREMMAALSAGQGFDAQTFENLGKKQREIAEAEAALKDMQKSWAERLQEDKQRQEELSTQRRTTISPTVPMMVNLNPDAQLQGRVKYYFPEGKKIIIGGPAQNDSDSESEENELSGSEDTESSEKEPEPAPDVSLLGAGIRRLHASVVNDDGCCILTALCMDAAKATCLNGFPLDQLLEDPRPCGRELLGDGLELKHRDHLKFGPCFFVFVKPTECSAEALIASGEADFFEAQMEETRAKRSLTEKRLRQSLFSPNQVLPGLGEMRDIAEELEQKKRELQLKDQLLRAKDQELAKLHEELDALRQGANRGSGGGLASGGHDKVSAAIDGTFEDALAQLSALESMRLRVNGLRPWRTAARFPEDSPVFVRRLVLMLAQTEEVRCSTDMLLVNPNRGFGWHQDNQNGPIEFDDAVRWWVAMDACGQDGIGAPEYLLGSHRNQSVSSDAVFVNLEDGDLSGFPRSTRYTPEPGDLIIWNARTIHRIVAPPGQKWVDGTQRRAIGGTMAKAGAKYINKGGASGISDLAGHDQKNGELLGGPYFPRIFPERVEEEEARCWCYLAHVDVSMFPHIRERLLSFAMLHAASASRQTTARRTAILAEPAVRSTKVHGATPFFDKPERIRRLLSRALNEAADPLGSYLEELDADHFQKLIDAFRPHKVPRDAYVIVQGHYVEQDKPGLFVLEDGVLEALKADKYEERVVQTYTQPGSIFGELAVVHQAPRAATVVARTDSMIWSVSRQTVHAITCSYQEAKRKYYDRKLLSVEVLQPLNEEERQQVIECLRTRLYDPGQVIIREGDEGHEFFLLLEGEAIASKNGRDVKTYQPGDYFGELALMYASPRAATVTAVSDCTLAVLAEEEFRRLLGPLAKFHDAENSATSRWSSSSPRRSGDWEGDLRRASSTRSTVAGCRECFDEHPARSSYSTAGRPSRLSCR